MKLSRWTLVLLLSTLVLLTALCVYQDEVGRQQRDFIRMLCPACKT
jgi:hypothetical protein